MKNKSFFTILLVGMFFAGAVLPIYADTLLASDFKQESWAKTIDFFDYARAYAVVHGMVPPPDSWHANLYMTYVNTSGLHMLYAGLENMTFGNGEYFTVPMQSILMHYKTENRSRDVVMASTFLMLMAFNETTSTLYPGSPDISDKLWASFSLSFNFSKYFPNLHLPPPDNRVTV